MADGVYFVTDGTFTKIGTSGDVSRRLRTLQTASPRPLTVRLVLPGGVDLEKRFHDHFADKRRHGEWFELTEQDIEFARTMLPEHETAPPPSRYVYTELGEEEISTLAARFPARPLVFEYEGGVSPTYEWASESVPETEKGIQRTLYALSRADSLQEQYELLLQATLIDLKYANTRSSYLDAPLQLLLERQGERVIARGELPPDCPIVWAGSLVQQNRCRRYLPRVRVMEALANSMQGAASPEFCIVAVRKSYEVLQSCKILLDITA
jgi:hypothetical protein